MLIKIWPVDSEFFTNTEQFTQLEMYKYFKAKEKILGASEKEIISGIEWGKISTETPIDKGLILKAETYCLVKDSMAIRIRIMGSKAYWAKIYPEAKPSLESIKFK